MTWKETKAKRKGEWQVDGRGTGRRPGRLVPGIPAATVQRVLSQTGRSRELVCLSVSVASCEAYIGGRGYGSPHTGLSLFSASRDTFLERLRTGPWSPALTRHAKEQVFEYTGPQISGAWCGVVTHAETQDLQAALSNTRITGLWPSLNIAGRFHRDH